jgi:hypothetical protein
MTIRRALAAATIGGSLALVSACGGSSTEVRDAGGQAMATTVVTQAPVTVTATPTPTLTPTPTPTVTAPVVPSPSATPTTFKMPKLVGVNLQLAQDILQKQGSYLMDQEDALGLDRIQVNDSNWQVCSQAPKAGSVVDASAMITLASVKLSEDCP